MAHAFPLCASLELPLFFGRKSHQKALVVNILPWREKKREKERQRDDRGLSKSLQTVPFPSASAASGSVNLLHRQTLPARTILLSGQPFLCDGNARELRSQWSVASSSLRSPSD